MIWRLIFGTLILVYMCMISTEAFVRAARKTACGGHGICLYQVWCSVCSCSAGYSGNGCEKEINECASNPCQHGICHNEINRYTCICQHGYAGVNCETNIDECTSSPCQHGTCQDGVNRYTCICHPGYDGVNCETEINECASHPCQHGTCTDGFNKYTCVCEPGFAGINCETNIECHSHPCMHGGICTDDQQSGHTCHCPLGFTGLNCEIEPSMTATSKIILEKQKTVTEGIRAFQIPCIAEGIPFPTVTWEAIDGKIPSNVKQIGHYLVFENVTMADAGYYMCTATNAIGTDIKSFHLKVLAKPTTQHIAPVVTAPSTVQVNYYMDAKLECHVTGFPTPSIMWSFNDKYLNSSDGILIIHRVTNTTVGLYRCIATNDAGSSQANIYLKVTYDNPKIISSSATFVSVAGESHNFTCQATGHPLPTITWSFVPLSRKSNTLNTHKTFDNGTVIEMVNMDESGELWCTAQNEFGMDKISRLIIVKHRTSILVHMCMTERHINECASNPCQHGTCQDAVNRYTCICQPGYGGVNCETEIDECSSNPCQHGTCTDLFNGYTCTCQTGYAGVNCETNIDECASSPCQHGTCQDGVNRYTCICHPGYDGVNCDTEINECASHPCQHGTCTDGFNKYTCTCHPGFAGINCETNIECHSHPCMHGGICTDDKNSGHTCHCPLGFTGLNCEIEPSMTATSKIILEKEKTVPEGIDAVKIPCFAEGIPIPTVTWEALDGKLPSNVKQIGHYLVFENVTMVDAGYYMCTATNAIGTDIKSFHLKVLAKPTKPHTAPLITAPSTIQVNYYTDARLECNVTGFPTPSIMWRFNDKYLNSSDGVLIIHRVTNITVGLYRCIATNDAGSSQANIYLKVTYDTPKIISSSATFVSVAGESRNFTCQATGHPLPAITWSFVPLSRKSNALNRHKTFENGTVIEMLNMDESGELWCTARNEFGMDKASTLVLVKHLSHAAFG